MLLLSLAAGAREKEPAARLVIPARCIYDARYTRCSLGADKRYHCEVSFRTACVAVERAPLHGGLALPAKRK